MNTEIKALLITIAIILGVVGFVWFIVASPLWLFNIVCGVIVFGVVYWLVWATLKDMK